MYCNATSRLNLNMSTGQTEQRTVGKGFVCMKNIVMRQGEQNIQLTATRKNGDTRRKDKNLSCRGQRHCQRDFERTTSGSTGPHTKAGNVRSLSRHGRCEGVPGHDRAKQSVELLPGYH